jgi:exoribonuclease-2
VSEELPLVWFERRSSLWLGAVCREGAKKLRLIDSRGELLRIPHSRVFARLEACVAGGKPAAIAQRLRTLRGEVEGSSPGEEELWGFLEDAQPTPLRDLSDRALGGASDSQLARLVRGLLGEDGRLRSSFRFREGAVVRLDADTLGRIQARAAEAQAEALAAGAFETWWREGGDELPPLAEGLLERMKAYALSGATKDKGAAGAAKRIGYAEADELLEVFEERSLLPRGVNEVPYRRGISLEFSAEVVEEARELATAALDPRGEDLRDLPTVAIDTPGTEEVDDAFSVWEAEGQTWLAVHIARPAEGLSVEGALNDEAQARATSVYFPGNTIPMLPSEFVARYSLAPGAEREALSFIAPLSDDDEVGPGRFTRTVIRVDAHLDYEQALDHPLGRELLQRVEPICGRLRLKREGLGAITLRTPNVRIEIEDGFPRPRLLLDGRASRVIAELMVLYNARLADALSAAGGAAPYRVQAEPVPPVPDTDDPVQILSARRKFPPTRVKVRPGPQLTMGLQAYVQASSPLRRYLDVVAQRQLLSHLDGGPWAYTPESLKESLDSINKRERRARGAEEDRLRYFLARWLEPRQGVVFEAQVSRTGERCMVFLHEWQREVPLRSPRRRELQRCAQVEVTVERAHSRSRKVMLRLAD